MRDEEIIALFFERSEQAIEALRDKYGVPVRCVARNILGSRQDAEECENDTYLGCWNSIPPHRPDPLKTYVCRIARNLAVTRYHSNTAQKRNSSYDAAFEELEECTRYSLGRKRGRDCGTHGGYQRVYLGVKT